MKSRGILGIIIIIGFMCYSIRTDLNYDEKASKNYIGMNTADKKVISTDNVLLSRDNSSHESVIEYTNETSSVSSISVSDISLKCTGSGDNKDKDEKMVENNMKLNVYFTTTPNGEKHTSLVIDKNEKIYIHIIKEYSSEVYPKNDVSCKYNITT